MLCLVSSSSQIGCGSKPEVMNPKKNSARAPLLLKCLKLLSETIKCTVCDFLGKNGINEGQKCLNPWEKVLVSSSWPVSWVGIGR